MIDILTKREYEAVVYLIEHEVIKIAADERCVSDHTEKNQIKSAMEKLGVSTQIGLIKEFFRLCYNVKFDLHDAKQMISIALLAIYIPISTQVDSVRRFRSRSTRNEYNIEITA